MHFLLTRLLVRGSSWEWLTGPPCSWPSSGAFYPVDNADVSLQSGNNGVMRYPSPLPSPLNKNAFTIQDGFEWGLSKARMRNSALQVTSRGIRMPPDVQDDFVAQVRPYTRVTGRSAASHSTAARVWELPLRKHRTEELVLHISRPADLAEPRRSGVIGHKSKFCPGEVVCLEGMYLTSRERTWLDLAETLTVEELVIIADHLIRVPRPAFEDRSRSYSSKEDLQELLSRHPGKKGIRAARDALQLSRIGADSPPETELRLAILAAGLPEPCVNQPLVDANGVEQHEPDLSYPEFRIAIEYEGDGHSHPEQVVRDIDREDRVLAAGWTQVRISKRHMRNDSSAAVAKIRTALLGQGWRPTRTRCCGVDRCTKVPHPSPMV